MAPDELDEIDAPAAGDLDDGAMSPALQADADDGPPHVWVCQCVCDNPGLVHR